MKEKISLTDSLKEFKKSPCSSEARACFVQEITEVIGEDEIVVIRTKKGFYPIGSGCRLETLRIKGGLVVLNGGREQVRILPENMTEVYSFNSNFIKKN
jgi:hypothetical protein